LQKNWKIID
jgi:hypothetical protein